MYRLTLTCRAQDSHRLTGLNAVKSRVEQLGLRLTDEQVWFRLPLNVCQWLSTLVTPVLDKGCNSQDQGTCRRPHAVNGRRRFATASVSFWYPER